MASEPGPRDGTTSFMAWRAGLIAGQVATPTARASMRLRSAEEPATPLTDLFGGAAHGVAGPPGSFYRLAGAAPRQPR